MAQAPEPPPGAGSPQAHRPHRPHLYGKHCLVRPDKDPNGPVYKAGKLVQPGKGAKPAAKGGKGKNEEKKPAKPVRKEGWAKPKKTAKPKKKH